MRIRLLGILGIFGLVGILLVGCGKEQANEDISQLFGTYSATGTITSTGTSLYRRGTHVLSMDEGIRFYLESKEVDLSKFADSYVVVKGEVVPNTHEKFLPVLMVTSAEKLAIQDSSDLQKYSISSLGISLESPKGWISNLEEGSLTFMVPEEEGPFVRIEASSFGLPEGLHVRIDGRNGIRTVDESEEIHSIHIEREEGDVILLTFAPKGEESALLRDAFYTLVQSVVFDPTSLPDEELRGAGDGDEEVQGSLQPCGGSAGVLCPEGEFCEVKEMDTGIGVCKSLGS
jgi:hypothetical protein